MSTGFGQKARVLIFGTGAGGINFYKYNRRRYRVIGFVDNNQQKQGQHLFGKLIHAPQQLSALVFDKIIIASDYYSEIYPQLTDKLAIDEQRIEVFHGAQISSQLSWFQHIGKRLEQRGYERMCKQPGLISDLLYRLFFDARIPGAWPCAGWMKAPSTRSMCFAGANREAASRHGSSINRHRRSPWNYPRSPSITFARGRSVRCPVR